MRWEQGKLRKCLLVGAAAALPFGLVGCGSETGTRAQAPAVTSGVATDWPTYDSVTELAGASGVVVRGVVGRVATQELDDGGTGLKGASTPVKFVELSVTQARGQGSPAEGTVVLVLWPDYPSGVSSTQETDLEPGREVIIFAIPKVSGRDAPGIDTVESFLTPVGGENGVFDIRESQAYPRAVSLVSLTPSSEKSKSFSASVQAVMETAQSVGIGTS